MSSNRIAVLSPSMINKIAAGEVIERPASVAKELLENAIDAGATQIELTIENGGADLIRIVDNGHGINRDDLPLSVTSHATSKISQAGDLFSVSTMGFRGEALASITEISQAKIRSRTAGQDSGYELVVNGGVSEEIVPCGCPVGTTIEIANLFYNTPVRRKFLKTTKTEMGHITEAFTRIALPNHEVQMTLRHGTRVLHQLPKAENMLQRIDHFFGEEISDALMTVSGERDGISLSGYVANPKVDRANNRMQYLFLNRRHIRDRSLQHALSEAYRGLLMTGRYPVAFLNLSIPADQVDVNVHPAKLEVRFQDGGRIYSHLLGTIRERFLRTDLTASSAHSPTPSPDPSSATTPTPNGLISASAGGASLSFDSGVRNPSLQQWACDDISRVFGAPAMGRSESSQSARQSNLDFQNPSPPRDWVDRPLDKSSTQGSTATLAQDPPPATKTYEAFQVHYRYLVTQDDAGMLVIDQHALHERIIYEQIREKILAGKLETQRLLIPEPVSLTAAEAATVLDRADVLREIGIEVDSFGGDTVLVTAYPAILKNINTANMLRGIVDILLDDNDTPSRRDVIDSLLHMMSCKAAVKAGDPLSDDEINDLLKHRDLCQDAHHCPHGRPTALTFSLEELDKRFKRT